VASEAAATSALDHLAYELHDARVSGRMVIDIPLAEIQVDYIERDRVALSDEDMNTLKQSLVSRGQQTPIEVVERKIKGPNSSYGLISGWRRYCALAALFEDTKDPQFGRVKALLRQPEDLPATYLAMVEENEIRANLSHFERARIVVKSVDQAVFETDKAALNGLFGAVSRAKRSKIKTFMPIVRMLDGVLGYPETLSERLGLTLSHALVGNPAIVSDIAEALILSRPEDGEAERAVITEVLDHVAKEAKKETLKGELESKDARDEILPGLFVRADKDGGMVLEGPTFDAGFRADLLQWLRQRANRDAGQSGENLFRSETN
ncbi:MAG: ParB/RepB/Spo0J family partition protein, partial [Rhodobacterales bacterium]|nr:ParB/RepB/Spo0J family partition protein [Rhodobacterales bacterium]